MINSKEYIEITSDNYIKKLEDENHYLKKRLQQQTNVDINEICGCLIGLFLAAYLTVYFFA